MAPFFFASGGYDRSLTAPVLKVCQCPIFRSRARIWSMARCVRATSPIIRIIDAMLAIPREAFVPKAQRSLAYLDLDIDVSEGGAAKRFLMKPAVTAKMLQAADISETDHVLVVGCATGYLAAVGSAPGRRVTATECDSVARGKGQGELWPRSALGNVTVKPAPVADGDSANAPFDVILLNGATEIVPEDALPAAQGRRPAGRGFRLDRAAAGHDRDRIPRRFRAPGAFRCRGTGSAGP